MKRARKQSESPERDDLNGCSLRFLEKVAENLRGFEMCVREASYTWAAIDSLARSNKIDTQQADQLFNIFRLGVSDLLYISIKPEKSEEKITYTLETFLKDKYQAVFGSSFYEEWTKTEELHMMMLYVYPVGRSIFQNLTPGGANIFSEKNDLKAKFHLHLFYFWPKYSDPETPGSIEKFQKATKHERAFFSRSAFALLCMLLKQAGAQTSDYITLIALGGEKLVGYYTELGFRTLETDSEKLMKELQRHKVPMYAKIEDVFTSCLTAKTIFF